MHDLVNVILRWLKPLFTRKKKNHFQQISKKQAFKVSAQANNFIRNITRRINILEIHKIDVNYRLLTNISAILSKSHFWKHLLCNGFWKKKPKLDNKQYLTSGLFIPRMSKLLVILFLIKKYSFTQMQCFFSENYLTRMIKAPTR